jgi:uncharacterized membrane protein YoaK (UPF0700 family)
MTGNMVQFSQNIAQYMLPGVERYPLLTLERCLSVLSFLLGSYLGAKGGARWGDNNRGWILSSAIVQSVFLFGASAILLSRPEDEAPSFQYWPGVIIMTAFSMGMQSIVSQKLVSPAFATVSHFISRITSSFLSLILIRNTSSPFLYRLWLSPLHCHRLHPILISSI